jgi:hypothetical protein
MPFDLSLTPLYRVNGQEQSSLPGLMASMPPRKVARGRDQDRLIVYLMLAGNAVLSSGEGVQLASRAAVAFYNTPGTLTSALKVAAGSINKLLHDLNMTSPGHGQYAIGWLAMAAIREAQITLLLSGPMHAFVLTADGAQHIFDTLSGKGLGHGQAMPHYFSQITLHPNDRLLISAKPPAIWEAALKDISPASLEATRRRLMTMMNDDVNAVLLQATEGAGGLTVLRPSGVDKGRPVPKADVPEPDSQETKSTPVSSANTPIPDAHLLQPSAYGIPPQPERNLPSPVDANPAPANPLASLPRAKPVVVRTQQEPTGAAAQEISPPRGPSERTRQAAKIITDGMQLWRRIGARIGEALQRFAPRLLPGADPSPLSLSSPALAFIALLVPLVVVTIASVVYFRYGRSVQYEEYLVQARNAQAQAVSLTDAAAQREAWQRELFYLDKAEAYSETSDTRTLRQQAQQSIDQLQGIVRLQFQPVLSGGLGVQISRLAASDNDLYVLDAQRGSILHIALTSSGFQRDSAFSCTPGSYGAYTVGPLVDILAMPTLNTINATVIGADAAGNLLYCAPGQVAQAIPLPPPDTNWGRVKAMTLDSGNLYLLDAQSHAVWVYAGKDGTFVDRPYFFFGGQIPELDDSIDLAVNGDDLFILHSDGHLSTCSYSRIEAVPTRCVDPASLVNPFPAYRDIDVFSEAHFTQMMFTPAPDSALLLLDSDSQGVFRFAPRALELQSQLRPQAGRANPLPHGFVGAMTLSPNHVLYFALQDRIYFSADSP